MKQSFVTKVRFIKDGEVFFGELNCFLDTDSVNFQFLYDEKEINVSKEFAFFALVELRLELEKEQIKLVCEGSRYDVYPSGMQLDGFAACELELFKRVTIIVDILDETQLIDKIATVKEQEDFYHKWFDSVNFGDVIGSKNI